jgi:ribosomal protein L12E/L44/L45/RPP1/RPP2
VEDQSKELQETQKKLKETETLFKSYKEQAETLKRELNTKINSPASPRSASEDVSAHSGVAETGSQAKQSKAVVSQASAAPAPAVSNKQPAVRPESSAGAASRGAAKADPLATSGSVTSLSGAKASGTRGEEVDLRQCNNSELVPKLLKVFIQRNKQSSRSSSGSPTMHAGSDHNALDVFAVPLRESVYKRRKDGQVTSADIQQALLNEVNVNISGSQSSYLLDCCESRSVESVLEFLASRLNAVTAGGTARLSKNSSEVSNKTAEPALLAWFAGIALSLVCVITHMLFRRTQQDLELHRTTRNRLPVLEETLVSE